MKSPHGGGASRPSPAVIVRPDVAEQTMSLSRVGPAGMMSTVFHALLFGLFALLAPRGQSFESEPVQVANIDVPDESKPKGLDLQSTFVDPYAKEPGTRTYANLPIGPESIPGLEQTGDPGHWNGIAGAPVETVPPPPGFGAARIGGAKEGADGFVTAAPVGPAGGDSWRPNVRLGPLGARGMTTERINGEGGNVASQAAVARGLLWLARVQSADGVWKLDGTFPDKGNSNDAAGTALGLLPFLGAGKTHKATKDNMYDRVVDKGLQALIAMQDKRTGAFSRDMYAHGLATIAMSEAFALSQDYNLKKPAQLALNFIVKAQHEGGGWRYSPGQAGDTSVTGWQIMALKSGLMAGLDVPSVTLRKAQLFLESVAFPATEGSGYTDPQPTPTMTAVSLLCRQYISGWGRQNLRLIKAVDNHIKPNSPRPDKKDIYFYYYATQVMHNLGGDDWKAWNEKMRDQLIASQESDQSKPATWGSWSPAGDQWGRNGGRLMMTSLNLLTLEVYYRYLPLYVRG